ncbi:cache domain-containing protein [Arcobacter sp. LA11]|uniref:cache domain-containing protein n=1 Tax=Arcobacter sp. LA11 TaxID=1898176 RepID=UPI00093381B5|nr:cache domain-containing protein [Arcobacter sp. LA11]
MIKNDENQILQIIKYTPPIFILLASILITFTLYLDHKKTLDKEKKLIKSSFIKNEKKRIQQNINSIIYYIDKVDNKTEVKLKRKLSKQIINAKAIISGIYENNKNSKDKKEIIKLIKDALQNIRFNEGRGYFFINQMDGISVFHPIFPKREGKNIFKEKDSKGIIRFQKVQKVIKEKNKGFEYFYFFNPNNKDIQEKKLAYVEYFKPYDWMIGTGEYIKDFKKNIQSDVLEYISSLRLGNENNYIFVMNYDGTFLYHPEKELEGKNISKDKSLSKMEPFFQKIEKLIPKDGGYYEVIQSSKSDAKKDTKKISYFKTYSKWDWIISTGFYEEDIQEELIEKSDYLEKKYTNYINTIIISSLLSTLILLFVSFYISKTLETKFLNYKKRIKKEITENEKQKNKLKKAQAVAQIGDWELNLNTMKALWSEEVLKIFGLEGKSIHAGPEFLKTIMHSKDWSAFECSMQRCINNFEEHKCIYRIFKPNGDVRWIDCRGQINKETNSVHGVIQDITDNKRLELEKFEKEELLYRQSKMAAMGEMLGNIAHQWRQPLSAISTASTGVKLQKELDLLEDKNLLTSMSLINESAQYLSQTIEDFRNFYKPKDELSYIKISKLIDKTLNLISAQFIAKDISIIKNIEDIEIYSLENELIQVLINILNNARDALLLRDNTKKLIFINVFIKNEQVYIEIFDNAGGIKNEILDRIFEPYFTTKHKTQGTGIGLYMSEEIVIKHLHGNIIAFNKTFTYENEKYTGAKFKIVLDKKI